MYWEEENELWFLLWFSLGSLRFRCTPVFFIIGRSRSRCGRDAFRSPAIYGQWKEKEQRMMTAHLFLEPRLGCSSSSSSDRMLSRNSNKSLRDSSWRYSSSLKCSNCASKALDIVFENRVKALLLGVSLRGRRWKQNESSVSQTWRGLTDLTLFTSNFNVRILSSSASSGMYSLLSSWHRTFLSSPSDETSVLVKGPTGKDAYDRSPYWEALGLCRSPSQSEHSCPLFALEFRLMKR